MDIDEKLILLYLFTALFALVFHLGTTNERMAKQGYLPHTLKGDSNVYWYKPHTEQYEQPLVLTF